MLCGSIYQAKKWQVITMLGIDDPQIWLAYILCIVSALGCMVYGLLKWNEEESEEW
ncbi:Hypothetical protein Mbur_0424 [Methanococcoides burtonii DSM 6242]|uniref:Uncharacterized protein n=1 Tax=Methanococcoides burtonii (strain DSM 6242 / NBRC 107633 / OCM 468 / ACE-M) TaxID=259564 RepID=Q12YR4_METBU|nr:Hypothetical protein Mbur_0424 [Methanococcoides burtonii DSM 6242]